MLRSTESFSLLTQWRKLALISVSTTGCLLAALAPVSTARKLKARTSLLSNQPPIANAGGVSRGSAGGPVQFNGTASSDPDGSIVNYAWNFGDNASVSGEKHEAPAHAYADAGTYTVNADGDGQPRSYGNRHYHRHCWRSYAFRWRTGGSYAHESFA